MQLLVKIRKHNINNYYSQNTFSNVSHYTHSDISYFLKEFLFTWTASSRASCLSTQYITCTSYSV